MRGQREPDAERLLDFGLLSQAFPYCVGIRKAHTDSSYGGILLRRHTRRDDTRPFAQHHLIAATLVFDLSIIRGYSTVFVARGISNTKDE